MHISEKAFLSTIALLVVVAITSTAYIFLIQKDYDVFVEMRCDSAKTICFSRDCSGGECPSNELEQYRILSIRAEDFTACSETTCLQECDAGIILCEETVCGDSEEDECVGPSYVNTQ